MSRQDRLPDAAPIVEAVDRVVLAIRDLAEAERIYTRMLGRTPSWRREDQTGGTSHILYRLANMTLELVSSTGPGPWGKMVATHLDERGEGLIALFLASENVVQAAATLTSRGLATLVLPENEAHGEDGAVRRWRNTMTPRAESRDLAIIATETLKGSDELKPAPLRAGIAEAEAISALDHIVVMTSNAEACKTLFGAQLGVRLALDHSKPEWGVRQLFFRLGGVTIEVVQSLEKDKTPEKDFFWGLAWKAGSIVAVRDRLLREKADVSDIRVGRKKGTEVATIRKPTCGVPTLLIGEMKKN